ANIRAAEVDDPQKFATAAVFREHWRYGRWLLASAGLNWVATDTVYLFLTPGHGFAAVGSVKAALNLLLPVSHALAAMSSISVPWLVRTLREAKPLRPVLLWAAAMSSIGIGCSLVLLLFGERLISLVYGSSFDQGAPLIYLLSVLPVVYA